MLSHVVMERAGASGGTTVAIIGGVQAATGVSGPLSAIGLDYQDRDGEEWERIVSQVGSSDYLPGDEGDETLTIVGPAKSGITADGGE
jgi:hypothetical protein